MTGSADVAVTVAQKLWSAAISVPLAPIINGDTGLSQPSKLRAVYLLPLVTAVSYGDLPYAFTTSFLLGLAVFAETPQWMALVAGALVCGAFGDQALYNEGAWVVGASCN